MLSNDSIMGYICHKTGMSGKDLSILVGANESTLCRYNKGERTTMPTEPLLEAANILQLLKNLPPVEKSEASADDKMELLKQAEWCRMQCRPLQQKLLAMQIVSDNVATLLLLLDNMVINFSLSAKKLNWIEVMRHEANKQLAKNNWLAQKKLAVKIELLLKEAEMYEAVNS